MIMKVNGKNFWIARLSPIAVAIKVNEQILGPKDMVHNEGPGAEIITRVA